eukprot:Gb_17855 [translate_table: standard]
MILDRLSSGVEIHFQRGRRLLPGGPQSTEFDPKGGSFVSNRLFDSIVPFNEICVLHFENPQPGDGRKCRLVQIQIEYALVRRRGLACSWYATRTELGGRVLIAMWFRNRATPFREPHLEEDGLRDPTGILNRMRRILRLRPLFGAKSHMSDRSLYEE